MGGCCGSVSFLLLGFRTIVLSGSASQKWRVSTSGLGYGGLLGTMGCEVERLGKGENLIVKVPRDKLNMFRIAGVDDSEIEEIMKGVRRRRGKRKPTEFDQQIGIIRNALKKLCPSLSVRKERGTGYGWIVIRGSGKWGDFTEAEKKALERFGLPHGANSAGISPESRKYYVKRAEEILKELGE